MLKKCGLDDRKSVLIACSGGSDSVAMVLLFVHTQIQHGLRLVLGHVNHGLRGFKAGKKDEKIVIELSKKYVLDYKIVYCDPKSLTRSKCSIEALARIKRYELLRVLAQQYCCDRIALGHTQNDHTETVYMRLLQGYGLGGMRGIVSQRSDIIRPLLCFSKLELVGYLKNNGQKWCEDKTNFKSHFLRNRFRKEIKKMNSINPRFEKSLLHLSGEVIRYQEIYDHVMEGLIVYQKMEDGIIVYPLQIFEKQLKIFQQGLVFYWFNQLMRGLCSQDFRLPRRFVSSLRLDKGPIVLRGYGVLLKKNKEQLFFSCD